MNTAKNKKGKRELSGLNDDDSDDNYNGAAAKSIMKKNKLNRTGKPVDAVFLISSKNGTSNPSLDAGLPSEMWATIMEYLPYATVKQVAATNKFFLAEVMSQITTIHLFDHRDMTESHAQRCVLVQKVNLCCIYDQVEYNVPASTMIIPFVSLFKKVKHVSLGSMMYKQVNAYQSISTTLWNGIDNLGPRCGLYNHPGFTMMKHSPTRQHERAKVAHHHLLHSFYGAVAVGVLKQGLEVSGLAAQYDKRNVSCGKRARSPCVGNSTFMQSPCAVCENLAGMLKMTAGAKSEGTALAHVVRDALKTGKHGGQHDLCLIQETGPNDGAQQQQHLEEMGRQWEFPTRIWVLAPRMLYQEQNLIEEPNPPEIIHIVDSDEEN